MTDKDVKQELITQAEAERWKKVLRGELPPEESDNAQREAEMLRNYLIKRDQDKAIQSLTIADIRNDVSAEQATLIYRQASRSIHRRSAPSLLSQFKPYLLGALVGALSATLAYLLLANDDPTQLTVTARDNTDSAALQNGKYRIAKPGEKPTRYPNMLYISGGSFTMGCSPGWDNELGCRDNEYPAHDVSIQAFEMAQHEVTVGQFREFVEDSGYKTSVETSGLGCGQINEINHSPNPIEQKQTNWHSPGFAQEERFPVTCVSWIDAKAYIDWLSAKLGEQYRLPSEAEWEYAARGERANAYFWGNQPDPAQANYNAGDKDTHWPYTSPVGSYPANNHSLLDTSGNVAEWVEDCSHPSYLYAPNDGRVWDQLCDDINLRGLRGGSWNSRGQDIRAAQREFADKAIARQTFGFRVARTMTPN